MRCICFSDIHFRDTDTDWSGRKLTSQGILLTRELVHIINAEKPDFAVCLGDLIEDSANDKEKDTQNLNGVRGILRKIKVPLYITNGNHDLNSFENMHDFTQIFDKDHSIHCAPYAFVTKGILNIFLPTGAEKEHDAQNGGIAKTNHLPSQTIEWLDKTLTKNDTGSKHTVLIYTHFAIGNTDMDKNWWFDNAPEDVCYSNYDDVQKVIRSHKNITAIIQGHQHWTKFQKDNFGILHITCPSLTENTHHGIPNAGFLDIEVENNNISIKERFL